MISARTSTHEESPKLEFRRRHNDYYATLTAAGSRDAIGVVSEQSIEMESWLGTIDRVVVRLTPEAKSVLLDIEGWRSSILDACEWLPAGTYMVGARVAGGVVGVLEGRKPMLRRLSEVEDRLGRKVTKETEEPVPSYMRTL